MNRAIQRSKPIFSSESRARLSPGNPLDALPARWQDFPRNFSDEIFGVRQWPRLRAIKENVKRVFYVRFLNHQIYLDLIAQRPEIRLDKLENDSPDRWSAPIMPRRTPTR